MPQQDAPNRPVLRLLIASDRPGIHEQMKSIFSAPAPADAPADFQLVSLFNAQDILALLQKSRAADLPFTIAFVDCFADGGRSLPCLVEGDPDLQVVALTQSAAPIGEAPKLAAPGNLVVLNGALSPEEVITLTHTLACKWLAAFEREREVERRSALLTTKIHQLESAREMAENVALQDPLTKLPNRRLFQTRLSLAIKHAERTPGYLCALLYLDIDRFKVINDSMGHLAGDELLVAVANLLCNCLRRGSEPAYRVSNDDMVARLGGDEFAIFLDNIRDASDALRISDRISERLRTPIRVRDKDVAVTVSIGVALSASHYTSADDMLRDADIAMYRAKSAGRNNCVLFDESMHVQAVERLYREFDLRRALAQHEFFLAYHPIISLADGKIESVEALLRWRSPKRGVQLPHEFLPLAEETGMMVAIGEWTLRTACAEARRWRDRMAPLPACGVSVNISSRQLMQPDFAQLVRDVLEQSGLDGSSLRLELSENVAMDAPERIAPVLAALQELDVRLSIDDFGTGYSSLKYLHRFSMDTLKIDRYFIAKMEYDERDCNIVRTIVSLAHNLQMKVVAEGAETPGQIALLSAVRCDLAQGHVFCHPMEAPQLEKFLANAPQLYLPPDFIKMY